MNFARRQYVLLRIRHRPSSGHCCQPSTVKHLNAIGWHRLNHLLLLLFRLVSFVFFFFLSLHSFLSNQWKNKIKSFARLSFARCPLHCNSVGGKLNCLSAMRHLTICASSISVALHLDKSINAAERVSETGRGWANGWEVCAVRIRSIVLSSLVVVFGSNARFDCRTCQLSVFLSSSVSNGAVVHVSIHLRCGDFTSI